MWLIPSTGSRAPLFPVWAHYSVHQLHHAPYSLASVPRIAECAMICWSRCPSRLVEGSHHSHLTIAALSSFALLLHLHLCRACLLQRFRRQVEYRDSHKEPFASTTFTSPSRCSSRPRIRLPSLCSGPLTEHSSALPYRITTGPPQHTTSRLSWQFCS